MTLLDVLCAGLLSRKRYRHVSRRWLDGGRGLRIQRSISINSSPMELYRFCREASNLPRILNYVESVTKTAERQLRWRVRGPNGHPIEWDTKIIEDRPGELVSWRSLHEAPIEHSGSIRFTPGKNSRGVIVRVEILHRPLRRGISARLQMLWRRTDFHVSEGLRRLKAIMETGEIPTTNGQPSGRPPGLSPVDQEVGEPLGLRALFAR